MTTSTKNKRFLKVFLILLFGVLTIIWTLTIFSFSLQPATVSSNISASLLQDILKYINSTFHWELQFNMLHNIFRKMAHFTEFFILGAITFSFVISIRQLPLYVLLYGIAVAISDETIQYFTSQGRAMRITDMIIDSCGVLLALIIIYLIDKIATYFKNKKNI